MSIIFITEEPYKYRGIYEMTDEEFRKEMIRLLKEISYKLGRIEKSLHMLEMK